MPLTLLDRSAKPCPWCEAVEVWLWRTAIPGKVCVACSNPSCAATGPFANTDVEAVVRWNTAPRRESKVPPRLQHVVDEINPPGAQKDLDPRDPGRNRRRDLQSRDRLGGD